MTILDKEKKDTSINIRCSKKDKEDIKQICAREGIDMSQFFYLCMRQAIKEGGITLNIKIPNEETLKAMAEGDKIIQSAKSRFDDADAMFDDLGI